MADKLIIIKVILKVYIGFRSRRGVYKNKVDYEEAWDVKYS